MSAYGEALRSTTTDTKELNELMKNLTETQKASVLASKKASEAEAVNAATKAATASATGVATFSMKAYTTALLASTKAMIAAIFTNPATWIIGIGAAITGVIALYKKWNPTIEEQKEKISELNDEYENTIQELKTLGDEIEKNTKRINELLAKDKEGTITLVEEDELKKLTLANKLLKEQQYVKKEEEIEQAEELLNANRKTFSKEFGSDINIDDIVSQSSYSMYGARILDGENLSDKELILSIKALYTGINDAIESGDEGTVESLSEGREYLLSILRERSSSMLTELLKYQETLSKFMNPDGTFDDAINQQMWDNIEAWKKEIYKQTNSSGEWNTLQIDTVLNDTSLQKTLEEIQQKFANGTLTESDIAQYTNLNTALEKANLILEEGQTPASIYLQYLNSIATSQNAVNTSTPDFSFNESNQGFIDSYQDKLNSLSDALHKINKGNLSDSDLLDLLQAFPVLTNKTDDLSGAISLLIDGELEKLKSYLQETGASDEILELFDNITKESRNISLDEMLSELESSHSMIKTLKDEVSESGKISVSTLKNIANQYPGLTKSIDDYLQGKVNEKDLLQNLQEEYEADLQNYKLYIAQKKGEDEDFYDLIVDGLSDDLINKAEQYDIELGNYTNYLEAKFAMDKEYALKKAELEKAIINIEQVSEPIDVGMSANLTAMKAGETKRRLEKEVADIEEVINGVNASISYVIPDFRTELFSEKSNDEFSEDIDWIARSIENAKNKVDDINEALSNTRGFKNRLNAYKDLEKANQELIDSTENASNKYKEIWQNKASKVDKKYVDLITGDKEAKLSDIMNDSLSIEKFSSEKEYNQVMDLIDAYDTWQKSEDDHNEALEEQQEIQDAINSIYLDRAEINLDILSLEDQDKMTVIEKNKWLKKEKAVKAEILKYNLLLAETDEERVKLQADYNKYLEENAEQQYQNLKQGRDNRADYFGTRIQDIENDIELAEAYGLQGTESQYQQMNKLLDNQILIYEKNYEEALKKRNTTEPKTDKWYQYNDEIQEAQDNINDCKLAQIENNKAMLLLPVKQYEDLNKELEKQLSLQQKNLDKLESASEYASMLIQEEIDKLNEDKEAITDSYDERIKAIQEQKDALTENNDEIQRSIDLENAKYNLDRAIKNRKTKIYRAGVGFIYESDQEEIRKAQAELDKQIFDNTIAEFDKEIQVLTDEKDSQIKAIDDEIKLWDDYAEKLTKVTELYDKLTAQRNFLELFGISGKSNIQNKDEGIIGQIGSGIFDAKSEVESIEEKIAANESTIAKITEEATNYLEKAGQIKVAQERINQIILDNEDELVAIESRITKTRELGEEWNNITEKIKLSLSDIGTANTEAKDVESIVIDERTEKIKEFAKTASKLYKDIAKEVTKANTSYSELKSLLVKAQAVSDKITALSSGKANPKGKSSVTISEYHSGGIVGKPNTKLPENLIALTDVDLKPNEIFAKLLNREVVLNNTQMGNLFNNLGRAYSAITPLNKRENSPITVSVGDVNVYNPDNTDMIVNEIVKELPLKVVQRLHSK